MPLPQNHPVHAFIVPGGQLVDVSAASISYAPVPFKGVLTDAICSTSAAVTGSDTTVTIKKFPAGVAANTVTLGTIRVTVTGAGIGKTYSASLTGSEVNRTFDRGDTLVFDSDGASSTTSIANFAGVMQGA